MSLSPFNRPKTRGRGVGLFASFSGWLGFLHLIRAFPWGFLPVLSCDSPGDCVVLTSHHESSRTVTEEHWSHARYKLHKKEVYELVNPTIMTMRAEKTANYTQKQKHMQCTEGVQWVLLCDWSSTVIKYKNEWHNSTSLVQWESEIHWIIYTTGFWPVVGSSKGEIREGGPKSKW